MDTEAPEKVELTDEQKLAVLKKWNESPPTKPPSLKDMIDAAFPGRDFDGRDKEGRAVKSFLASRQLRARPATEYEPKDAIQLTEEQQEYIVNNASTMKCFEMAKILFKNDKLPPRGLEVRAIVDFVKTLNGKAIYEQPGEDETTEAYVPPKTQTRMMYRINRYVQNANLDENKLTAKQKKDIHALIGYIHTYRFLHQIKTYDSQTDRDLYESSFIRYTWDKNDLTEEEVDQFIILSTEVVMSANIQRHIRDLQKIMDDIVNEEDDVEKRKKFSQGLVDAIGQARKEYNDSVSRQDKMLKNLVGKRSERLSSQIKDNATILNLVQMWQDEKSRQKLIHLADMRKQLVKDEIDRLSSLEEVKCRILGISEDEILNG